MTKYETMLVTSAKLDEEATQKLVGKFKSVIEANGTIEAVDEWGKRRLAYPINKEEEGIYTLIYFESGPDFPTELERRYRITDGVLRSMIIARPEGAPLPQPKEAPKAEAPAAAPVAEEVKAEAAPAPAEEATPAEEPKAEEAPAPVEEAPAAEAEAPAEEPAAAPAEEAKAEPEQEA